MSDLSFKGPVEGYVVNQLSRHYWRVRATMEWDDVMQEARVTFLKVSMTYPGVEDKHLMSLFKTAWSRRFTDMAEADTASRVVVYEYTMSDDDSEAASFDPVDTGISGNPILALMIEQAPSEIKTVLNLFLSAPAELLELATSAWRAGGRKNAEGNKMVNKLLGRPANMDSLGNVERYFLSRD